MTALTFIDWRICMKFNISFFVLAGLLMLLSASDGYAQTNDQRNRISVSGEGIVKVEPDMVSVRFGVVTRDEDPVKARQLNEEASAKALEAVRNLGVPKGR
jgi:uncharacterized protein YggE